MARPAKLILPRIVTSFLGRQSRKAYALGTAAIAVGFQFAPRGALACPQLACAELLIRKFAALRYPYKSPKTGPTRQKSARQPVSHNPQSRTHGAASRSSSGATGRFVWPALQRSTGTESQPHTEAQAAEESKKSSKARDFNPPGENKFTGFRHRRSLLGSCSLFTRLPFPALRRRR